MLPTGDLSEYKKPQLIAAVKEMLGLRVVRSPDGVYAKLVFQYFGIENLHGLRHCVADICVALVPVKSTKL